MNRQHRYSLTNGQIQILDELMNAEQNTHGVCYHDENGKYHEKIKNDLDRLKKLCFISEYISQKHITPGTSKTEYAWSITYHGIAFLVAYHTIIENIKLWNH